MRRVVSVWLPAWAIERQRRLKGETAIPVAAPLALVETGPHGLRLAAVNEAARAAGLLAGMALADARATLPGLLTRPADAARDRAALVGLARWCGRYGPARHADGEDGVWIDITGVAHLFAGRPETAADLRRDAAAVSAGAGPALPGEAALLGDLVGRLATAGVTARAGLAGTLAAAHAMARFAATAAAPASIVAPEAERAALAPLPVAALRLDEATGRLLERLGLRRIGDLYPIPRASLERRFREAGRRGRRSGHPAPSPGAAAAAVLLRLDQALGEHAEPRAALPEPPRFHARLPFPEPLVTDAGIRTALARLTEALAGGLAAAAAGGRRFDLALYRSDGTVAETGIGTSSPCRDAAHLCRLLAERTERLDAGHGIDLMTLTAREVERLGDGAVTLDAASPAAREAALLRLLDRLSTRLGERRVLRLEARPRHLPEAAQKARPAIGAGRGRAEQDDGPRTPAGTWRPPLLLDPPEPVTVLAALPEGPPALIRWRRVSRRIVRAEGPERIAPPWWSLIGRAPQDAGGRWRALMASPRDYYAIEDATGSRYWVFRAGHYATADDEPRWFMHGLAA